MYVDKVVKQVLICGIANLDIKEEVLGTSGVNDKNLAETLGLIEDKETALRSTASSGAAAHTITYKRIEATDKCLQGTGKCEKCGKTFNNRKVQSRTASPHSRCARSVGGKSTCCPRARTVTSRQTRKRRPGSPTRPRPPTSSNSLQ